MLPALARMHDVLFSLRDAVRTLKDCRVGRVRPPRNDKRGGTRAALKSAAFLPEIGAESVGLDRFRHFQTFCSFFKVRSHIPVGNMVSFSQRSGFPPFSCISHKYRLADAAKVFADVPTVSLGALQSACCLPDSAPIDFFVRPSWSAQPDASLFLQGNL